MIQGHSSLQMTEHAAASSIIELFVQKCIKGVGCIPMQTHVRNYSHGSCKVARPLLWKLSKRSTLGVSALKFRSCLSERSIKCNCFRALLNPDIETASDWVVVVNQVLLMASIFLTYTAGVIPGEKSCFTSPKNISYGTAPEKSTISGSGVKFGDQINSKNVWNVVSEKLMDALNAIAHGGSLGDRGLATDQYRLKQPLSLDALADGPRFRLFWACFQQLLNEVNSVSENFGTCNRDDWMEVFSKIMRRFCYPVCMRWLEEELCLENRKPDKALLSSIFEKLKGDDTVLQYIRKSGKEDLFADLICFLRFNSLRNDSHYNQGLFTLHGVSILEDLVITLSDGITSIYLEFISVDGNMSTEINSLGLILCTLSTRELQRLRNQVALNQWLLQNMEVVVSMYEDRFDLWTLQSQVIDEPIMSQTDRLGWWRKFTVRKSESVSLPSRYYEILHFSMPVKRIKELRALKGWRYYFSLFLELSDIAMPFVIALFTKASNAVSFFLVCLIGRSLGLIYTGIRQSLRWK